MNFKFGRTLDMQLDIRNASISNATCEVALHTYFELGDATQASISGLESHNYRDQLTGESCAATGQPIRFTEETDRVYDREVPLIEIQDPVYARTTQIRPRNSQSTVVWNPWIAKSIRLTDFGDLEYGRMCCVETANVGKRQMQLAPRETLDMGVEIAVAKR
jgi:glucose-6-phosphate 1-epimerase